MISIIVPVFNGENYINNCIEMILCQTYNDFELIVINDGSSDKTVEKVVHYATLDKRVRLYSFENHGVGWSRNYGIKQSKGDFIMFVDCDDYIENDYLEKLIACFDIDCNIDAVYAKVDIVNESKELLKSQFIDNGIYDNRDMLCKLLDFKHLSTGPCAKMYKRNVLKDISFPVMAIYEDLIFNIDFLSQDVDIYFTNKTSYKYIHRENIGAMNNYHKNISTDVIVAMDYALSHIDRDENYDYLFYRIISQVMMYAVNCSKVNNSDFIHEVQKFLRKYYKDLFVNKSINTNEKIMYLLYGISFDLYCVIRRMAK